MIRHLTKCVTCLNQGITSYKIVYTGRILEKLILNNARCVSYNRKYSSLKGSLADADADDVKTESDEIRQESNEFMKNQIEKYHFSKRWLAKMMGEDPETFSQDDMDEAIRYLLPSSLHAKDARPMLKHPYEVFPKSKESEFDADGRPIYSAFYTGTPKYQELVFDIWSRMEKLNDPTSVRKPVELDELIESVELDEPVESVELDDDTAVVNTREKLVWANQLQLEEIISETMSEKNYNTILFRLQKLANHERANEIEDFLEQFQVPLHQNTRGNLVPADVFEESVRAMGKRKTAVAEVVLREGSGTITVNEKPLLEYFNLQNDREQVMFPLLVTDELDRFDIEVHLLGGGASGQSGAIRLGLSRAIAAWCPQHVDALTNAGLLRRDHRRKERKKPGQKRARKKFQWVKR